MLSIAFLAVLPLLAQVNAFGWPNIQTVDFTWPDRHSGKFSFELKYPYSDALWPEDSPLFREGFPMQDPAPNAIGQVFIGADNTPGNEVLEGIDYYWTSDWLDADKPWKAVGPEFS